MISVRGSQTNASPGIAWWAASMAAAISLLFGVGVFSSTQPSGADAAHAPAACAAARCTTKASNVLPDAPAPAATFRTGHTFVGATTAAPSYGVQGTLTVVDPTFPAAGQMATDWLMVNDAATNSGCTGVGGTNLIQVGWVAFSDSSPEVFEYDSGDCQYRMYSQFPLSAGQSITVSITASGDVWTTWIEWNGTWRSLGSFTAPWNQAPITSEQEETYSPPTTNAPWPVVPVHQNSGTELAESPGQWQPWSSLIPTDWISDPTGTYCATFPERYTEWSVGDCYAADGGAQGYTIAGTNGAVVAGGDATNYGSLPGLGIEVHDIVGIEEVPGGGGYWLIGSDGGVFAFGDAQFYGSLPGLPASEQPGLPIVALLPTADGHGYWEVTSGGDIYSFGDAQFYGSTGNLALAKPIVGATATADGHGYWLVASDGGIFAFGDAPFYGSYGAVATPSPIVAMVPEAGGYLIVCQDGSGGAFGPNAKAYTPKAGVDTIVGAASDPKGGFWMVDSAGSVAAYNGAPTYPTAPLTAPAVGIAAS